MNTLSEGNYAFEICSDIDRPNYVNISVLSGFGVITTEVSYEQYANLDVVIRTFNTDKQPITEVKCGDNVLRAEEDYVYDENYNLILKQQYLQDLGKGEYKFTVTCDEKTSEFVLQVAERPVHGGYVAKSGGQGRVTENEGYVSFTGLDGVSANVFSKDGFDVTKPIVFNLKVTGTREQGPSAIFHLILGNHNADYGEDAYTSRADKDITIPYTIASVNTPGGIAVSGGKQGDFNRYRFEITDTDTKLYINDFHCFTSSSITRSDFADGKVYLGIARATEFVIDADDAVKVVDNNHVIYSKKNSTSVSFRVLTEGSILTVKNGEQVVASENYEFGQDGVYGCVIFKDAFLKTLPAGETKLSIATDKEKESFIYINVKKSVTLTFYESDGTTVWKTFEDEAGEKILIPENPPKVTGKVFKGWKTEKDGNTLFDFSDAVVAENDMVFYAHYENAIITVYFDYNGAENEDVVSLSVEYGTAIGELPAPVKENCTFKHWADAEGNIYTSETLVEAENELVLYAVYELSAAYKDEMKALVDDVVANYSKNDYTEESYNNLLNVAAEVKTAIDNANDNLAVEAAIDKLNTAVDELVSVLENKKTEAKNELKSVFDALKKDDYTEEAFSQIKAMYENGLTAIDECLNVDEVNNTLQEYKNSIEELKVSGNKLENYKNQAKQNLEAFIQSLGEENYTQENWGVIAGYVTAFEKDLSSKNSEKEVDDLLSSVKAEIAEVERVSQSGCGSSIDGHGAYLYILLIAAAAVVLLKQRRV